VPRPERKGAETICRGDRRSERRGVAKRGAGAAPGTISVEAITWRKVTKGPPGKARGCRGHESKLPKESVEATADWGWWSRDRRHGTPPRAHGGDHSVKKRGGKRNLTSQETTGRTARISCEPPHNPITIPSLAKTKKTRRWKECQMTREEDRLRRQISATQAAAAIELTLRRAKLDISTKTEKNRLRSRWGNNTDRDWGDFQVKKRIARACWVPGKGGSGEGKADG